MRLVIQLARAGEPVAYAILAGLGVVLFLLVVHQVQRTINDQNKVLVEMLQQRELPSPGRAPALGGFLIDPAQFDVLDEK